MKTTLIVILMLKILSPLPSHASSIWSKEDICREIAYIVVLTMDFEQTKNALANLDDVKESNVFLGQQPSNAKINQYTGTMIFGHGLISNFLSSENRKLFQNVTIIYHANIVYRNHMIGARINF